MQRVEPKVFLVGETRIVRDGLQAYLEEIGAPEWKTDAPSDCEELIEVYGRMCYRSWRPGMNPNVTRVREGNDTYLDNITKVRHGSVTEHSVTNWIFHNVSRVFTHELVRHRVGTAMSQESLRFVRLTDLSMWIPPGFEDDPEVQKLVERAVEANEADQLGLAEMFGIDEMKSFSQKKKLTSAFRRLAPIGLATAIGWSANIRTLRHVIEMRTSRHAEVEIRLVFDEVAKIAKERWPNAFADYTRNDHGEWVTERTKI